MNEDKRIEKVEPHTTPNTRTKNKTCTRQTNMNNDMSLMTLECSCVVSSYVGNAYRYVFSDECSCALIGLDFFSKTEQEKYCLDEEEGCMIFFVDEWMWLRYNPM